MKNSQKPILRRLLKSKKIKNSIVKEEDGKIILTDTLVGLKCIKRKDYDYNRS